jgi:nucleotide-binding universal stress UspA family protein
MKILAATDGSQYAMKAVRRALELAMSEGANVTLVTVAPGSFVYRGGEVPLGLVHDEIDPHAVSAINEAKALFDEKGIQVATVLERGKTAANAILDIAAKEEFDLIIMGSTGKTGIERFLIGTTASKVVTHAQCSVAVIR